ncbi:hypothetical protein GK047_10030 [Paenibacillus sp. SYP-B3998]|uniref:Transcription regulator PadR N-terminal domain-containing protein n=1 Tax=Paenibacillus sp. SYP-B3998 TaxID=2678564 RepID=A0A6G3ZXQ1_9BACL|nr:hypothetical protein [Paenibacillus sp. SYP-B3998]
MYFSLKRLEQEDNITSYWGDETQGGRRKYYHLTDKGTQTYTVNRSNWEYAKKYWNSSFKEGGRKNEQPT